MKRRGRQWSMRMGAMALVFGIAVCTASPAQAQDTFRGIVQKVGGVAGSGLSQFRLIINQ